MRWSAFFFPLVLCLSAHAQQTSEADYQAKLKQLQVSIATLQQELKAVKGSRDQLQSDLEATEKDIGSLAKKVARIKRDLASQKKQLSRLNHERAQLQQAKHQQQKHIAEHINAAYRLGQQSDVKLLLNQQDPTTLARMLKYYDYFLDARAEKIDTYLETISELDQIEPKIQQKSQQLADSQHSLKQRFEQLSSKQQQRQRTLAKLNAAINNKDQELKQLAANRQRFEQLITQVATALANIDLPGANQPFLAQQGKLKWPARGAIAHRFGSSRAVGKLKWDGVLINAKSGSDVKAIHHGRVVFSDYLRGHGLLLIVDHGDGYMSLYAHNQALLKETGEWVTGGETIAGVGNSGGQTQAGLYFEIRHNGKPTNPGQWCRG